MIQQEEGLRKVIRYEGMGVHPAVLRRFLYTGWTNDTEKRLASHNRVQLQSTQGAGGLSR